MAIMVIMKKIMAKMPTVIMINTQNNYLSGSYFVFGSETMDIIYPNNIADAIPAPVALFHRKRPPLLLPLI